MNNFAELSDGDSAKFLVRWRGRQEGPYLASVIEAKLAANEIGLLHEIFYEGKWVTIRDYVRKEKWFFRAQLQAQVEQERRAREEAERQTRERKNNIAQQRSLRSGELKLFIEAARVERQSNTSHAQAAPQIALNAPQGQPNSHHSD